MAAGEEVGRRWTHFEIQAFKPPKDPKMSKYEAAANIPVPAHWPPGVRMDTADRVSWLVSDWGQGLKITAGGKECKVWVSPAPSPGEPGALCYHKVDIEKKIGRKLPSADEVKASQEAAGGGGPKTPESKAKEENMDGPPTLDWPEWLPEDWTIGRRISGGKPRKSYVSPMGKHFWNRDQVEVYVAKGAETDEPQQLKAALKAGDELLPKSPKSPKASPKAKPKAKVKAAPRMRLTSSRKDEPLAKQRRVERRVVVVEENDSDGEHPEAFAEDVVAETGYGFSMRPCRGKKAWLVLPKDVVSIDLQDLTTRIEGTGWKSSKCSQRCHVFGEGPVPLKLYASGRLLVLTGNMGDASKVAHAYACAWLVEGDIRRLGDGP